MIGLIKIYVKYYLCKYLRIRRKPRILQFPITSKCNSRCLTCNIWKYKDNNDVDSNALRKILINPFFAEVRAVGVNGGEPSLHSDFINVIKTILILPKLEHIAIISNCINGKRLLELLKNIYPLCKSKNVKLQLQISIDGIGNIHNHVRGVKTSFDRSMEVFKELYENQCQYVDSFDIGCTISRENVDYLAQIQEFFSEYDVPIYYHLAVPNKRIHNFDDAPFSVLNDKHATQMAKEFFYSRYLKANNRRERIRYFLIYLFLDGKTHKRMFMCNYLYRDITINECLDTFLCATASDKVGNLLVRVPSYQEYNKLVLTTQMHCNKCIHYANIPNFRGIVTYYKYKMSTYQWVRKYKNAI